MRLHLSYTLEKLPAPLKPVRLTLFALVTAALMLIAIPAAALDKIFYGHPFFKNLAGAWLSCSLGLLHRVPGVDADEI